MGAVVDRARACIGARFRLHGRDVAHALDCVGVAAHAFGIDRAPAGYALRGGDPAHAIAAIDARLCRTDDAAPGALLLLAVAPFQLHLAIVTPAGFVHADAALRRVVEVPGLPRWPVLAAWRSRED